MHSMQVAPEARGQRDQAGLYTIPEKQRPGSVSVQAYPEPPASAPAPAFFDTHFDRSSLCCGCALPRVDLKVRLRARRHLGAAVDRALLGDSTASSLMLVSCFRKASCSTHNEGTPVRHKRLRDILTDE